MNFAFFISPHGLGHAARAAAVMEAAARLDPGCRFEVFTTVPEWFFRDSGVRNFGYHPVQSDVGLVQVTSLEADLPASVERLDRFLPFQGERVDALAQGVRQLGCERVVCDIAPLGIAVARAAGLRAALVENFLWDWIYQAYAADYPAMGRHAQYLAEVFALADWHIQAEPVCRRARAHLAAPPVARRPREGRSAVRRRLGIPEDAPVVLFTLGGGGALPAAGEVEAAAPKGMYAILAGAARTESPAAHVRCISPEAGFYHPDLVQASDAVIGKVGYSTLAEVYQAGVPFGYVARADFRESVPLVNFVRGAIPGIPVQPSALHDGSWGPVAEELLRLPRVDRTGAPRGDEIIAGFLLGGR